MRIAVTGASGQLGTDVLQELERVGHEVAGLTHSDIELTDVESIHQCLDLIRPDVLINTAAAHHVERCEEHPDRAHAVNAKGAGDLARWCASHQARMLQISTDYVFDGAKSTPYVESDAPAPLNTYGSSKLAGEQLVQSLCPESLILRVSGLYGVHECRDKGANFVDKMIELAGSRDFLRVVDDEFLTPTSTAELARQITPLLDSQLTGIAHASAQGSCSWYRFAAAIFEYSEINIDLQIAGADEFKMKVPRPKYSVMENSRLQEAGVDILQPWQDGLRGYLETQSICVS